MNAIKIMTERNKQSAYTLVVGLGKTGLSVVRYLNSLGENIVVADSCDTPLGLKVLKHDYPEVKIYTGQFNKKLFLQARRIIVSPGVPLATSVLQQAKDEGIEICGDIDLFAHEVVAPVLGITGSNGKSTVTSLVTKMAIDAGINAAAGGNIGLPVLDLLNEGSDDEENKTALYVLELSSFQLETLNYLPIKAAVVLNISADHLDRYENLAAYAYSKQLIYDNSEIWVINVDDVLASPVPAVNKKTIEFTLNKPAVNQFGIAKTENKVHIFYGEKALISVQDVKLKGKHNLQNILAALALGTAIDLPLDSMLATLKSFPGLPHRTQWVAELNGVNWINDSKATNVGAAIAAIKGLPGKQILIAGGESKNADFSELASVITQHCRAVILLGKDAALIEQAIQIAQPDTTVVVKRVIDMRAAIYFANEHALSGDNIILAPACASFDMFENFEHRGEVFIQEVKQIIEEIRS